MSVLSDIVAKFRKGSPNIAAAFDEVERRLVAVEGSVSRAWDELADHDARLVALEDTDPEEPPPPPPPGGTLFLKWDTYEDVPHKYGALDRMTTVTLPVMPAGVTKCVRTIVNGVADSSTGGDGTYAVNRNDGQQEAWFTEGLETWESVLLAIPDGTSSSFPGRWTHSPISSGWDAFYEFHEPNIAPRSTIPIGAWGSDPPVWECRIAGGSTASPTDAWFRGPAIEYNRWHHFLFHWKWSATAGQLEAWLNGQPWITHTTPNILAGNPNFPKAVEAPTAGQIRNMWATSGGSRGGYFEVGHYRGPQSTEVDTTYWAKVRIGTTRDIVLA